MYPPPHILEPLTTHERTCILLLTYLNRSLLMNAHSPRVYGHMHTNAHICTHTKYIRGAAYTVNGTYYEENNRAGWQLSGTQTDGGAVHTVRVGSHVRRRMHVRRKIPVYGACGPACEQEDTCEEEDTCVRCVWARTFAHTCSQHTISRPLS